MSALFDSMLPEHQKFIGEQHVFFVATATAEGRINLSPKGMDSLRILDSNRLIWLNLTGSGNETSAHVQQNPRMTIMFCSFEGKPLILRLYGQAKVYHPRDKEWQEHIGSFKITAGARQIFELDIESVQTSCGFAVPLMEFQGERDTLSKWTAKKDEVGIMEYWEMTNRVSLDGLDTHILE